MKLHEKLLHFSFLSNSKLLIKTRKFSINFKFLLKNSDCNVNLLTVTSIYKFTVVCNLGRNMINIFTSNFLSNFKLDFKLLL